MELEPNNSPNNQQTRDDIVAEAIGDAMSGLAILGVDQDTAMDIVQALIAKAPQMPIPRTTSQMNQEQPGQQ